MTTTRNILRVAALAMMLPAWEAVARDCRSLERRNYLPTPQQRSARWDQERPRRYVCGADDLERLMVGDYCVRHLEATEIVLARVFATGTGTIAVRALLSVQVEPYVIAVDINLSYIGRKRYFGEARDDAGRGLIARRVKHPFPQEDDEDVPPPCINTSFVTVALDPAVLRSRRWSGYRFSVIDDDNHRLTAHLSGKIVDAVLKAAETKWAVNGPN